MLCSVGTDQEPDSASVVPLLTAANCSLLLQSVVILLSLLISNSKRELESILFAEYDFCQAVLCNAHSGDAGVAHI